MSDEKDNVIPMQIAGKEVEMPIKTISKGRRSGKDLQAIADEMGVSPFEILLKVANRDWKGLGYSSPVITKCNFQTGKEYEEDIITLDHALAAAKEAAQYLHPKKRAVEVSGDSEKDPIGLEFKGSIVDLIKIARG